MALRLLEAHLPEDLVETARSALTEVGAQEVWSESGGPFGAVVNAVMGTGRTGAAIDRLHECLANVAGFRVLVLPLEAVVPRPLARASEGRPEQPRSALAVSREEVYASVAQGAQLNSTYLALTALSATAIPCCPPVQTAPLGETDAVELATLLKAVADPVRLRLISLIAAEESGEACACNLTEPTGRSQATVSHHLGQLTKAGILRREQRGKWAWFSLDTERLGGICASLCATT